LSLHRIKGYNYNENKNDLMLRNPFMENIIEQLKSWLIISYKDIIELKQSIARRHAPQDRAKILAKSVHDRLDMHLKGLSLQEMAYIKRDLILKTLIDNHKDIYRYDILEIISEQTYLSPSERIRLTKVWFQQNTDLNVDDVMISEFLKNIALGESLDVSNTIDFSPVNVKMLQTLNQKMSLWQRFRTLILLRLETLPIKHVLFLIIFCGLVLLAKVGINQMPHKITAEAHAPLIINRNLPQRYSPIITNRIRLIKGIEISGQRVITLSYKTLPYNKKRLYQSFHYVSLNYIALRNYLMFERQSILVNDTYLNEIIVLAKLNDIDPLLLLAIIGQEQGFIPMTSSSREAIVNNPYNVYHSWQNYNTSLRDTTQIAINLLKKRLAEKPAFTSPLTWVNIIYAEDPNWATGVTLIYDKLNEISRTSQNNLVY